MKFAQDAKRLRGADARGGFGVCAETHGIHTRRTGKMRGIRETPRPNEQSGARPRRRGTRAENIPFRIDNGVYPPSGTVKIRRGMQANGDRRTPRQSSRWACAMRRRLSMASPYWWFAAALGLPRRMRRAGR